MLHPAAAYARLVEQPPPVRPLAALRRPAIAAIVAGTAVSIAGTGRLTAPLLLSTSAYWSFAIVWQMLAAAIAMQAPRAPLTAAQRFDLFFTGHAPWSLWLLIVAAWSRIFPSHTDLYIVLCTAAIPAAWTSAIVYGFCTTVLQLLPSRAMFRMLLHQALIWLFAFVYVAWAVALPARASALFTR
jgi:hypothetical protein